MKAKTQVTKINIFDRKSKIRDSMLIPLSYYNYFMILFPATWEQIKKCKALIFTSKFHIKPLIKLEIHLF